MDLLKGRGTPKFGTADAVILAAYTLCVAWAVAHRTPWADEAQSWLLARDAPLSAIFATYLHYEGSPGLWHLILWPLCRMHVSYTGMHWLSALIPITGIWVFLRYSPFPLILRATLPFTFYLVYQYAVVARSYILVPLLVFVAAALLAKPGRNLVWIAVTLGLLGNTCLQALALSGGFAFILVIQLWQNRRQEASRIPAPRIITACVTLTMLWSIAILTTTPVADNSYLPTSMLVHRLAKVTRGSDTAEANPAARTLPPVQSAGQAPHTAQSAKSFVVEKIKEFVSAGIASSWILSTAVLAAILIYLCSRKRVQDIAPYFLVQLFFIGVVSRPWHHGLLFIALIGILWINWPPEPSRLGNGFLQPLLLSLLLIVVAGQCWWSERAFAADLNHEYSGDRMAADFLKTHITDKQVAGFQFWSVGVLPYFPNNIFINQRRESFWLWSRTANADDKVNETIRRHPDYILIGFSITSSDYDQIPGGFSEAMRNGHPPIEDAILATGLFEETHRFCGDAFSGGIYHQGLCQVILEPRNSSKI